MPHHRLEPEATGTIGRGAVWTRDERGHRTQADPVRCEFAGWLGDDIVDVQPDVIVSGRLADALRRSDLTGFELRDAVVTTSSEFVSSGGALPTRWERLVVVGDVGAADDVAGGGGNLLVSERALALLNDHRIVEARLEAAGDTAEAARFVTQRDERRAAARASLDAMDDARFAAETEESARVTALLAASDATAPTPPTMRTNAKQAISGDLTLAATALGKGIDDDAALALLRLLRGPIVVKLGGGPTYRSADNSMRVWTTRGIVTGVDFRLRTRETVTSYAPMPQLIDGVDPFTREATLDRLGEPKATKDTRSGRSDEYRLGRKRLILQWAEEDLSPSRIILGHLG